MRIGTGRRLGVLGRIVVASTLLGSVYGGLLNVAPAAASRAASMAVKHPIGRPPGRPSASY